MSIIGTTNNSEMSARAPPTSSYPNNNDIGNQRRQLPRLGGGPGPPFQTHATLID